MRESVEYIIKRFNMKIHPEGGYYSAGYRSQEFLRPGQLPARYDGPRNLYSSIHFLVTPENPSRFHRLRTDELWHFYKGCDLELHLLSDMGNYTRVTLSAADHTERFQFLVKRNTWLAASCAGEPGYALAGCTLAPGFEFADFELAGRRSLTEAYPRHEALIARFTKD